MCIPNSSCALARSKEALEFLTKLHITRQNFGGQVYFLCGWPPPYWIAAAFFRVSGWRYCPPLAAAMVFQTQPLLLDQQGKLVSAGKESGRASGDIARSPAF